MDTRVHVQDIGQDCTSHDLTLRRFPPRREIVTTLMQDVFFALRQLRKTPGFTLTVLLTLALGIGANAAIFTLVNTVLLKNLPVADPNTLIRLGDTNDCCVGMGSRENGDYSLFSTATYELLKKNVRSSKNWPPFRRALHTPIIARRDKH